MTDQFPAGNGTQGTSYPDDGRRQLTEFIASARWFGGKGRDAEVTDVQRLAVLSDDGPRVVVDLVEVGYADGDPDERDLYQVPLSFYAEPQHRLDHAFVGWWDDPEVGWTHAYDAVHDRDAMAVFLRAFAFPPDGPLTFRTLPGVRLDATAASTPLSAEQSNSSVMFGDEALLKLFRRVTPGVNPDIEIHDVLTRAGSDNVAALLGWVEWGGLGFETGAERPPQPAADIAERPPQPAADTAERTSRPAADTAERPPQPAADTAERTSRPAADTAERPPQPAADIAERPAQPAAEDAAASVGRGGAPAPSRDQEAGPIQLGMLQQFLRTASDGWELALTSVRNLFAEADLFADEVGGDFAGEAQRLGEAVGRIHALLAEHFPTQERTRADHARLAEEMTSRLEAALDVVPELAEHAPALRALFAAVGTIESGRAQRVHGDLHLGQTLRTAKGWKIVDFEGEPAKPLSERVRPDSPWRDVAGMLRSFDYAPRVTEMTAATTDDNGTEQRAYRAAEWSARNQAAFLDAYAGHSLGADERTLLTAYVADKAVYECVYEARNRPAWLPIPLAALGQATRVLHESETGR